jgi:hypothetical protein
MIRAINLILPGGGGALGRELALPDVYRVSSSFLGNVDGWLSGGWFCRWVFVQ